MNNYELEKTINDLLLIHKYKDYAPNGIQIEGKQEIQKVICGVTASMELIERAINEKADAIIVHHGYFWKGEKENITGIKQKRIKALLENNINLYAYHLPLDGHQELGNNAQLGKLWNIINAQPTAEFDLLWYGNINETSVTDFGNLITQTLEREPLIIQGGNHTIKRIAWCSGAAQGFLEQAVALGVDAFISGEISEKTFHEAKEYGIHYFGAGHHATEKGGIMALCEYLNSHTTLECQFIDCWNPV